MREYSNEPWLGLLTHMRATEPRDEVAWREACVRLRVYARLWLKRIGISDPQAADDVVDRVLTNLHGKPDLLSRLACPDAVANVQAYLATMVRNAVSDYGRQLSRQSQGIQSSQEGEVSDTRAVSPLEAIERQETLRQFRDILDRELSDEERQLLRMRFWNDRSINEIATATGVAYHTAARRLYRLQEKLRSILEKHM